MARALAGAQDRWPAALKRSAPAGAGAYKPPAGAAADMTLRLNEPAFVLDAGLVRHEGVAVLDSGAPRACLGCAAAA